MKFKEYLSESKEFKIKDRFDLQKWKRAVRELLYSLEIDAIDKYDWKQIDRKLSGIFSEVERTEKFIVKLMEEE